VNSVEQFNLEVGKKYLAIKPAHSFGEIDGVNVDFDEKRIEFEVLPKPDTVMVCDGETEEEEPLPIHLAQSDWLPVRDLKSGSRYWFNPAEHQVNEL
jgi:hypothetical protein